MMSLARLGRVLGLGVLGLAVSTTGLQIVHPVGLQPVKAATLRPLAGFWSPTLPNAPIASLHITERLVIIPGDHTVRLLYVVDATGRAGKLGGATAPVPADASAPVTVTFHTNACEPVNGHCTPAVLPSTTTMTLAPGGNKFFSCSQPCSFLTVNLTTQGAGFTQSFAELMIQTSV